MTSIDSGEFVTDRSNIELDKIPGSWIVTYWRDPVVTLRLRIFHATSAEPDVFVGEIRTNPEPEFILANAAFSATVAEILNNTKPSAYGLSDDRYGREFLAMASYWATLSDLLACGSSGPLRYPLEPISSVDCSADASASFRHM